jgi:hypothetical protein
VGDPSPAPLAAGYHRCLVHRRLSSGYIGGSIARPLAANLWRTLFSGAVLAGIARWRGEAWPRGLRQYAAAGVVGVLLFSVQFGGLYIGTASGKPASTTALVACSSPLLVAAVVRRWAGTVCRSAAGRGSVRHCVRRQMVATRERGRPSRGKETNVTTPTTRPQPIGDLPDRPEASKSTRRNHRSCPRTGGEPDELPARRVHWPSPGWSRWAVSPRRPRFDRRTAQCRPGRGVRRAH